MRGRVFRRGGSWSYVVDVGPDTHTRRKQRMKGGFKTKREAERALRDLMHALDRQRYVEPSARTLRQFLEDEWLPAMKPHLRPATWAGYGNELRLNVTPRLGEVPLQDLNALQLNQLYTWLLQDGRKDGRGGLSPRSVRYVHTILRKALHDAARWGLVERNVADLADPPRHTPQPQIRTWTPEELRRFLDHVSGERLFAAWLLMASTGMRRGEVLGLRWQDVDLGARRVSVRSTLILVDGRPATSEPKTRRSRRTIDLDQRTTTALARWRETQETEHQHWPLERGTADLAFTREDGAPIHPDGWSGTFERYQREAGLPVIRLHDLRHTHATLMLAAGVNPKVVSERLGHHSTAFTLDVYSHVVPGMQQEAAERVAQVVLGPSLDLGHS